MTARTIPLPDRWAQLDAHTYRRIGEVPGTTQVQTVTYTDDAGTVAVLLEIATPTGYATVALPLPAARLLARAILSAAEEMRDDWPADALDYRQSFGLG